MIVVEITAFGRQSSRDVANGCDDLRRKLQKQHPPGGRRVWTQPSFGSSSTGQAIYKAALYAAALRQRVFQAYGLLNGGCSDVQDGFLAHHREKAMEAIS